MKMEITILKLDYQRNGISGIGFFTALINLREEGVTTKLIVTFETQDEPVEHIIHERTRVINPSDITSGWRGDKISFNLQEELDKLKKKYKVDRIYYLIEKIKR